MDLKSYLLSNNLSLTAFGRIIGVTPPAIAHWAEGRRIPSPEWMAKIYHATEGQVEPNSFYKTEIDIPPSDLSKSYHDQIPDAQAESGDQIPSSS